MVYDTGLCSWMNELWERFGSKDGPNQIKSILHSNFNATAADLLRVYKIYKMKLNIRLFKDSYRTPFLNFRFLQEELQRKDFCIIFKSEYYTFTLGWQMLRVISF